MEERILERKAVRHSSRSFLYQMASLRKFYSPFRDKLKHHLLFGLPRALRVVWYLGGRCVC